MYYSQSWTIPTQILFELVEDTYKLELSVPGFQKENIEILVEDDGILFVKASNEKYGEASREFYLPEDIVEDKISAIVKNGILTISGPRQQKKRNKITVE